MRAHFAVISPCLVLAACSVGRQHQTLGTGRIVVAGGVTAAAPGVVAPGPAGAVAATAPPVVALPEASPSGEYRVRYQIWLPRAMEVAWTLRCGAHEERGVAGETFEQYTARRVAELQAERARERERRTQVGSLVGGLLVGNAQAGAGVATPSGSADATVTVDGAAAGAAMGAATVTDAPIALAHDDLGQGYRQGEARFWLGDLGGACAMEVAPLDPAADVAQVAGSFSLERWYNARRAERRRVASGAVSVRADLQTRLVAGGADAGLLARRRAEAEAQATAARVEAEAQATAARVEAQAAAELHARAEAQAQLAFEARVRDEVWMTRERWYTYLGKCGGNRHHREELAAREQQRAQLAITVRGQLRLGLIHLGADAELAARLRAEAIAAANRRAAEAEASAAAELAAWTAISEGAAGTRGRMMDALIAGGARLRPPMPPPIDEVVGVAPASGAEWTAGYWTWNGAQWMWIEGRWVGGDIITVEIGGSTGGGGAVGGWDPHGGASGASWEPSREQVRDHRPAATEDRPPPKIPELPKPERTREQVRDHRTEDKKDDDKDKDNSRPRVRDHR